MIQYQESSAIPRFHSDESLTNHLPIQSLFEIAEAELEGLPTDADAVQIRPSQLIQSSLIYRKIVANESFKDSG